MINKPLSPKEVEKMHIDRYLFSNRPFFVQLMNSLTKKVIEQKTINGWRKARMNGIAMLKQKPQYMVVRIYDPSDHSCYDFITHERIRKLKEGKSYNGKKIN